MRPDPTIFWLIAQLVAQLAYTGAAVYIVREFFHYLTHRLDVLGAEKATIFQKAQPGYKYVERPAPESILDPPDLHGHLSGD